MVTYEFQFNPKQWGFVGEWIDPETNLPLPRTKYNAVGEVVESVFFEIYDQIDFGILGLDFSRALGFKPKGKDRSKRQNNAANSPDRLFI